MSDWFTKTYVVQRTDADGVATGEVLAVKLTKTAARQVAKNFLPAKVVTVLADKTDEANGPGQVGYRQPCN